MLTWYHHTDIHDVKLSFHLCGLWRPSEHSKLIVRFQKPSEVLWDACAVLEAASRGCYIVATVSNNTRVGRAVKTMLRRCWRAQSVPAKDPSHETPPTHVVHTRFWPERLNLTEEMKTPPTRWFSNLLFLLSDPKAPSGRKLHHSHKWLQTRSPQTRVWVETSKRPAVSLIGH